MIIQGCFLSCESGPEPVTENSTIAGYAGLDRFIKDDSIMVVATGPYGKNVAVTDKNGLYKFTGLGNGTYSLAIMKEGYGTIKQYGIQLFGYDSVKVASVRLFKLYTDYKIPVIYKISTGPLPRSNIYNCLILSTHQKLGYFPLLFFLSSDKNVNFKTYKYCIGQYFVTGPFESVKDDIIYMELNKLPFKSGEEVFLIGYVCNLDEFQSGYFDRFLGTETLSTFESDKHTPVMSFIMP